MACAWRLRLEPAVAPSVSSGARIRPSRWWYTETTGKSRCYLTAISRGGSRVRWHAVRAHRTTDISPRLKPDFWLDRWWGGLGSNPRPADYENYGPVHRAH